MKVFLLATLMTLFWSGRLAFGQAGGIPFHVDSPISTTPSSPLRKFSPTTNRYAYRIATEPLTLVNDIRKVEPQVLAIFYSKVPERDISNRGEPFNATDVVVDSRPQRRFVLAGNASNIWFILYEHGGIGYHHNLMVFSRDKNWRLVAAVAGFLKNNTFDSLKQALKAGTFFDQPGYPQY